MSENFCAMPFHHLAVKTDGEYSICCRHENLSDEKYYIQQHASNVWHDSNYVQTVRESFLNDKRHPGCAQCWHLEDNGFPSLRTKTEHEYKLLGVDVNNPGEKNIEIQLSNTCNLKCLMCDESSSSSILSENKKLGINKFEQKDFYWNNFAFEHLSQIINNGPKILSFRGGEPLYEKRLLKILEEIDSKLAEKMILHITTNATVWNDKWQKVVEKFKLVRFMFSIDGIQDYYEYIRYPANWKNTEKNINAIKQLHNSKCLVNSVVMNLNIFHLSDLVEWCAEQNLYQNLSCIIKPNYLQIDNLPQHCKIPAMQYLSSMLDQELPKHIRQVIESSITVIDNSKNNIADSRWNSFIENISQRDNLRQNSFNTVIPW